METGRRDGVPGVAGVLRDPRPDGLLGLLIGLAVPATLDYARLSAVTWATAVTAASWAGAGRTA